MQQLNLPSYARRVRQKDGKLEIFDFLRHRYVALTPEEWVRQHFTHYLVEHLSYPAPLMANEIELRVGNKRMRCDSVLFDRQRHPCMVIEYKAPTIVLNQQVLDQVSTYNRLLQATFIVVSNGLTHFCMKVDKEEQKYLQMEEIPSYENILHILDSEGAFSTLKQ